MPNFECQFELGTFVRTPVQLAGVITRVEFMDADAPRYRVQGHDWSSWWPEFMLEPTLRPFRKE